MLETTENIDVEKLLNKMLSKLKAMLQEIDSDDVVMLGVHTGGYWIAEYLFQQMKLNHPLGSLNISFYRDDFTQIGLHPEVKPSKLPINLDNKHIILVDDVLFTGRTVKAALNEIFDYGRPASVKFVCLIDRGGQELPISADIVGIKLDLTADQQIKLSQTKQAGFALSIEKN